MSDLVQHTASLPAPDLMVQHYLEQSLSSNTRRAYKMDVEAFIQWGGYIPCGDDLIALYLSNQAQTKSIATLSRYLVSIRKAHRFQNYDDPTNSELVRLTMRGIKRLHGKPQHQVSPILKEDLVVMLSHCSDTIKGRRDAALLILGFCGALRRSELVAVNIEEIEFASQGLVLTLPRSKTDQTGQGRKIAIPKGRGKICPVTIVGFWINLLSELGITQGALFCSIKKGGSVTGGRISDRAVVDLIKAYAKKAGLNPEKYSGHSLRAGLCTSAAQHGIPSWKIREQTGHKTDTMLARYIRDGGLFENNAAGLF